MAHFLQPHSTSSNEQLTGDLQVRYAKKLKELKDALANIGEDEQLIAVDAVQRLGIDYRFQEEIEAIMKTQCTRAYNDESSDELRVVSLRFRLLRQQGYHVTTDVFNKFKSNEKLKVDINGLVGLYEASHMSFPGEEALVEAGRRSHQLLTAWMPNNLDDHRASAVAYSLEHPHHKSLTRFMAKNFLHSFEGKENWVNDLRELGKLEFNMVESLIRNEIQQVSKWWKELGLTEELKFVRDQPIKWYTWPMACLADPNLSEERVELTKSISLVYIIDDIFDVHGTLDELILFTAAVERWDIDATGELPNFMKICFRTWIVCPPISVPSLCPPVLCGHGHGEGMEIGGQTIQVLCFKALYDITNETSYIVHKKHGWNPIESLKKSWATLCKAFLLEARWFSCGHLPNTEEYLNNGFISSGVPVVLTHGFFLLGQGITKETVHILDNLNISSLISSTATILRLWDDLGSAKDEGQDGYDGSYIECYVNENQGCSDEDAQAFVVHRISEEWKFLNQECFSASNPFSASFTKLALNVARMVPLMYDYNSQHRLPSLEENMKSLLFDSFLAQGQVTSAAISQA